MSVHGASHLGHAGNIAGCWANNSSKAGGAAGATRGKKGWLASLVPKQSEQTKCASAQDQCTPSKDSDAHWQQRNGQGASRPGGGGGVPAWFKGGGEWAGAGVGDPTREAGDGVCLGRGVARALRTVARSRPDCGSGATRRRTPERGTSPPSRGRIWAGASAAGDGTNLTHCSRSAETSGGRGQLTRAAIRPRPRGEREREPGGGMPARTPGSPILHWAMGR